MTIGASAKRVWVTHISLVRKAKLMYILAARVFANTMAAASSGETFTGQARVLIISLRSVDRR